MRRSHAQAEVAVVLLAAPRRRHWGYDLSRASGVRSGVLYPILHRMLEEKWLTDGWEQPARGKRKAPPRRYYKVTEVGRRELASLLDAMPMRSAAERQPAATPHLVPRRA